MDAVLAMMPEEEAVRYSAMSGQSLFYMGETNLKHKILAIAEEEGAESASYALKVLQSDGQLTMASTGKDPNTGKLITQQYHVEGPVMIFLTTTAIEIDEELLNRCVVLTVNESREQTQAIHAIQRSRQTLEGLLADQDRKDIIQLHQNVQRLLRPVMVANPYAEQLTFLDDKTRIRRDHMKYLTLINTIALLHQYQRPIHTLKHKGKTLEYIEVLPSDIETANQLAGEVLGRTLDELPPQSRRLLMLIHDMVQQVCESQQLKQTDYRFTRKEVRAFTGWGNTQLKIHMKRLEDMEYVLVHRSGRGQAFVYELLFSQENLHGQHHLTGLIDPEKLQCDAKWSGQNKEWSGLGRPQVGGVSGAGHSVQRQSMQGVQAETDTAIQKDTSEAKKVNGASYRNHHTFTPFTLKGIKVAEAANPRSSHTPVVEG